MQHCGIVFWRCLEIRPPLPLLVCVAVHSMSSVAQSDRPRSIGADRSPSLHRLCIRFPVRDTRLRGQNMLVRR
jgi:hypothetical protein